MSIRARGLAVVLLSQAGWVALAAAQTCDPAWMPGQGVPGVQGTVTSITEWDPDGAGPLGPRIVTVGDLFTAGRERAFGVAAWDGAGWAALGGLNNRVDAVAALPGGDLIVGGTFTTSGFGEPTVRLARFTGSGWAPFGATPDGNVLAMAVHPDGSLIVGGGFAQIGGIFAARIARFSGGTWSILSTGVGIPGSSVNAIAVAPDGSIVVGGSFPSAGGGAALNIARWTGAAWQPLGSGVNGAVDAIEVLANGDVLVAGQFTTAGGAPAAGVARWNGTSWSTLGAGPGFRVRTLEADASGVIWAGGEATGVTTNAARLASWDGQAWTAFGSTIQGSVVRVVRGDLGAGLVVAGSFSSIGDELASGIVRLEDAEVVTFGEGGVRVFGSLERLPDGSVIAIGSVRTPTSIDTNTLIRWTGRSWERFAPGAPVQISDVAVAPNGDVIAAGLFTVPGDQPRNRVVRFDGEGWQPLGPGLLSLPFAVLAGQDGEVYIGGRFLRVGTSELNAVARWDGSVWSSVGPLDINGTLTSVDRLAFLSDGRLVAAGGFNSISGTTARNIAIFDEEEGWTALGAGVGGRITALKVLSNGDVVVGGNFVTAGGAPANQVARWNGSAWSPLGEGFASGFAGSVADLAELSDGAVLAVGTMPSAGTSLIVAGIAKWNGAAWIPYGDGLLSTNFTVGPATSVLLLGDDDFVVAGSFFSAGDQTSVNFARWSETGRPIVALPPRVVTGGTDQSIVIEAAPARGTPGVSFRWEKEIAPGSEVFAPIADGPGGASPGGGVVGGASGALASPATGDAVVLSISGAREADSGRYRVVFFNTCGESASSATSLSVASRCEYDFNQDENVDLLDAQQMAQVFVGLIAAQAGWLDGDLNGDENADLTDAQLLAAFVVTGVCGV
jgi:hypothetical protein